MDFLSLFGHLILVLASPFLFGRGLRQFILALKEQDRQQLEKHIRSASLAWGTLILTSLGLLVLLYQKAF